MQDGHRTSINSASLTSDEVARRSFPTVRKGFDPTDVRMFLDSVAEQLQTLYDREDDLRRRLARAEHQAAHPEMDEAMLTAALGQETTRVLRSAHDAAGDMKAQAEEGASQVVHQAHEEAARIRAEGERVAADRASEADVSAAKIRSGAAAEADSVLDAARQEAQALVTGVQEDCRGMVREAQEVRARVLADLVRRRRALYGQVEQLRGGRQNLVEALREARRSFDHILETLQRDFDPGGVAPADDGAGETGDAGVSRPDGGRAMVSELRDVGDGNPVIAPMREPPRRPGLGDTGDPRRAASGLPAASVDPGKPGPPPTRGAVGGSRDATREQADSGPMTPDEPALTSVAGPASTERESASTAGPGGQPEGEQARERRRSGLRIIRRSRHAPADEPRERPSSPTEATTTDALPEDEGVRILASPPDTARPAQARSGEAHGNGDRGPGTGVEEQARQAPATRQRGRTAGRHRAPGSSAVDELFAKVKAGRSPSEKARERPETPASDTPEGGVAGPGGRPESGAAGPGGRPESAAGPGGRPESAESAS
jgi:DivIVA domain-containing protein